MWMEKLVAPPPLKNLKFICIQVNENVFIFRLLFPGGQAYTWYYKCQSSLFFFLHTSFVIVFRLRFLCISDVKKRVDYRSNFLFLKRFTEFVIFFICLPIQEIVTAQKFFFLWGAFLKTVIIFIYLSDLFVRGEKFYIL